MLEILIHWGMTPEAAKIALSDLSFWCGLFFGTGCASAFWRMVAII